MKSFAILAILMACIFSVTVAQGYGGGGSGAYVGGGGGGYGGGGGGRPYRQRGHSGGGGSYGGGGGYGGQQGYSGGGGYGNTGGGYGGGVGGGYGGGQQGYSSGGGGYGGGGGAVPYNAGGGGDFSGINKVYSVPSGGGYGSMSNYKPKYDTYPGANDYDLSMNGLYNSVMGLSTKLRNFIPNLRLKFLPPAGHTIMKHNRIYVDKARPDVAAASASSIGQQQPSSGNYGHGYNHGR